VRFLTGAQVSARIGPRFGYSAGKKQEYNCGNAMSCRRPKWEPPGSAVQFAKRGIMTSYSRRHGTSRSKGLFADIGRLAPAGLPGQGRRLAAVFLLRSLKPLHYPISSGTELTEQLQGSRIRFMGLTIETKRATDRIPAHYFPIASGENFVEKIADLLKGSRLPRSVRSDLKTLARQLPSFQYPISDSAELMRQLSPVREVQFRGRRIDPRNSINSIPRQVFPIQSKNDFAFKVAALVGARALRTS